MRIREGNNKSEWNNFIKKHGPASGAFLHSWEWGVFQESVGREVERFVIEDGETVGAFMLIKHPLPAGKSYLYCPRGPVAVDSKYLADFKNFVTRHAKERGAIFVRFELLDNPAEGVSGDLIKVKDVQPAHTLLLDLTKSEESLLNEMHGKTRYNFGLAKRKGVEIQSLGVQCLDEFWKIMQETTARDKFAAHAKSYYDKMLRTLGEGSEAQAWLATAFYENTPIAVNLMVRFGETTTYLHGASSNKHRNVMAPHLLQWEMIRKAKQAGKKWYDFWGIAPPDQPGHPWAGITRFKKGFGGQEVHYGGTYDLPVSGFWYKLYQAARRLGF